jgi:hypothetical protein
VRADLLIGRFSRRWRLGAVAFVLLVVVAAANASVCFASLTFSKLAGEMATKRYAPAFGLLPSGKVLIAGGFNLTAKYLRSAEFFDPATGGFEPAPEMLVERDETASAALPDGRLLVVGGFDEVGAKGRWLQTAELFNPGAGSWEKTGEMTTERDGPGGALLPNGKVLVVGGAEKEEKELKSGELYDPATGTFEKLASPTVAGRYEPAVVTLPSGKVLIAGGFLNGKPAEYLKSAELFNPETRTFEPLEGATHELVERHDEIAAVLLPSGKALLVGGYDGLAWFKSMEVFNPETNTFELAPAQLSEARTAAALVQFADGSLFVAGGARTGAEDLASAEATPPVSTTSPASGLAATTAALNGTVEPEAESVAYFQYGTTTAYGSSTPHQNVSPSPTPVPVSAALTGLAPNTTYHYRLLDTQVGTTYGADQTFTTAASAVALGQPTPVPLAHLTPVPAISAVHQSHPIWREGTKLAQITSKRPPVGTTFSFTLNAQAAVSLEFTQQASGRKAGGKCVPQTKANRHKRACKRTVARGILGFTGHLGTNKVAFQGRISRTKKLQPGTYTLAITAANGPARSSTARLTFKIVR